jgi:hypothetical protein
MLVITLFTVNVKTLVLVLPLELWLLISRTTGYAFVGFTSQGNYVATVLGQLYYAKFFNRKWLYFNRHSQSNLLMKLQQYSRG